MNTRRWERRKPSPKLTAAGGLALVEFQLARRGAEFARTMPGSNHGDIWADCDGHKISIEVKTTFESSAWHIRRNQHGADFYCLVSLDDACCYVLRTDEVQQILQSASDMFSGVALVKRQVLPPDAFEGWARMGFGKMAHIPKESHVARKKTVRHKLANGEIRTYSYPKVL